MILPGSPRRGVTERCEGKPPTPRQRQLLLFWAAHIHEHGYPPTLREALPHMGMRATNALRDLLYGLERRGLMVVADGVARGAVVTKLGWALLGATSSRAKTVEVLAPMVCQRCGATTFKFPCFMCRLEIERYLGGKEIGI